MGPRVSSPRASVLPEASLRVLSVCGLAALVGTGCLNTDRFVVDYAEAACQYADDCGFLDLYGSKDDCLATLEQEATERTGGCDLDRKAARDCLDAVEQAGCEAEVESVTESCVDVCQ